MEGDINAGICSMSYEEKLRSVIELDSQEEITLLFEEIYNSYYRYINFTVSREVNNSFDAEEIVNDVFANFYLKMQSLKYCSSIGTYLYKTAKNTIINYYRSNKKRENDVSLDALDFEIIQDTPNEERNSILSEFYDKVKDFISESDIELLYNHLFKNFTFAYIAKKEKVSMNTIKSRYFRALNKVREKIVYEKE